MDQYRPLSLLNYPQGANQLFLGHITGAHRHAAQQKLLTVQIAVIATVLPQVQDLPDAE